MKSGLLQRLFSAANTNLVSVFYSGCRARISDWNRFVATDCVMRLQVEELERRQLLSANIFGDFDGDGFDDLAVGVPAEDIGGVFDAGAVNIAYGSADGLTAKGSQFWHQNSPGILGRAQSNDSFGRSLAVGDFNRDGFDDLAIGVPGEDVGSNQDAGAVNVLYGSKKGLSSSNNQLWHQNRPGVNETADDFDFFGTSLAAGDFNKDGRDDLVVGVPRETISGVSNAGVVNVLYGGGGGLSSVGDQVWNQRKLSATSEAENFDDFGLVLAVGDFNGNGYDDLAVGIPKENIGSISDAGAVNVIYGASGGLGKANQQFIHQDTAGVRDKAEKWDRFGFSLAAGDFNGDGRDDLAIGVPMEDFNSLTDAGIVNVLFGSARRLGFANDEIISQSKTWTWAGGQAENNDQFGYALATGKFNQGKYVDLAVGVPLENWNDIIDAGAIGIVYGGASGFAGNQVFSQDTAGMSNAAWQNDKFGFSIGSGDFNGDRRSDLAIGIPNEDVANKASAGAVAVIYGRNSGLSAKNDQFWTQGKLRNGNVEQDDQFGWSVPFGLFIS